MCGGQSNNASQGLTYFFPFSPASEEKSNRDPTENKEVEA